MESALRGVRADLASPALNMSPSRWNICLLRFHPKHKNRLFITGKTDLTVGFPGGARLRDAGNWTGDVGQRRRAGRDRPRRGGGWGWGVGGEAMSPWGGGGAHVRLHVGLTEAIPLLPLVASGHLSVERGLAGDGS